MKKVLYDIEVMILCTIIWVILNESISVYQLALGVVFGLISVYITNHILISDNRRYHIRPFLLLKYFLNLIIQIYLSGFSTIKKIMTGKINPDIVEIETKLSDDLDICLLANSITLTPGTVTIDKKGGNLKILWIDCITKDKQKAGEIIKGKFEKILLKGD